MIWASDLSVCHCNLHVLASAGEYLALQTVPELEMVLANIVQASQLWQSWRLWDSSEQSVPPKKGYVYFQQESPVHNSWPIMSNSLLRHNLQAMQHFGANQAVASPFISISPRGSRPAKDLGRLFPFICEPRSDPVWMGMPRSCPYPSFLLLSQHSPSIHLKRGADDNILAVLVPGRWHRCLKRSSGWHTFSNAHRQPGRPEAVQIDTPLHPNCTSYWCKQKLLMLCAEESSRGSAFLRPLLP